MREEAAADVSRAVAARRGAGHPVRLPRLPGELRSVSVAVSVAVLLPLGRQRAARRAAVRRVLPRHVTLSVTARDRTPGGGRVIGPERSTTTSTGSPLQGTHGL